MCRPAHLAHTRLVIGRKQSGEKEIEDKDEEVVGDNCDGLTTSTIVGAPMVATGLVDAHWRRL